MTEWYACVPSALTGSVANLRNSTGEERRQQTLCDKRRDNTFFEISVRQTSLSFKQMFLQRPENVNVK